MEYTPKSVGLKAEPTKKPEPAERKKSVAVGGVSATKVERPTPTTKEQAKRLDSSKKAAAVPTEAPSSSVQQSRAIEMEVALPTIEISAQSSLATFKRPSKVSSGVSGTPSKKVKVEETVTNEAIPMVSLSMTANQLKAELKARDPHVKGLSGKSKHWLILKLGAGSKVHGSAQYKERANTEAAELHQCTSLCHPHPLADSRLLRAPTEHWGSATTKKRINVGTCNVRLDWICTHAPYRSCERCDYDICNDCFAIESLPQPEKEQKIQRRLNEMAEENRRMQDEYKRHEEAERQREERYRIAHQLRQEERMQELYGDDLERFSSNIRKPGNTHIDSSNKYKYSVWTADVHRKQYGAPGKGFNSSFSTLEEANLRAEYVFFYDNPWGCDKDDVYADNDTTMSGGLRYLRSDPDGGGSWTVSVLPSEVFNILDDLSNNGTDDTVSCGKCGDDRRKPRVKGQYAKQVRSPSGKHTNEQRQLKYTIWQSDGYDNDGWHSYGGPPDKMFNSSYDTLEEANERVEYVFYYQNPWGSHDEDFLFAETDKITSQGFRYLECCPPDSSRWTVSVIPSVAFEHINL